VHLLAARPVAELQAYEAYTAEHGLPLWRIEHQLAQIAMLLDAQRRPGHDLLLSNYLARPVRQAAGTEAGANGPPTEAEADAVADTLGFKPMNRKKTTSPQPPDTPA
jgi:hypothetical protein